jgi:CheY-like chemotaxis protein
MTDRRPAHQPDAAQKRSEESEKLILVVDDEIDITETFSMLLALHGFKVITAPSAYAALTLLETQRPDVIVSDCMMPSMDGVAFCNVVRSMPALKDVHFILMSGAPERHMLNTADYDAFLRKPFPFELVLELVQRLANGPGRQSTS